MMNFKDGGIAQIAWTATIILMTLKFAKQIDWSWWAVTAPLWICAIVALFIIIAWIILQIITRWRA